MKNIVNTLLAFSLVIFSSASFGFATIISGKTQTITVDSQPQGAEVIVDGAMMGHTPVSFTLQKGVKQNITIKKDGYSTVSRELTKSLDPVALLNIFWDLSTTDALTGSLQEYSPNSYFIELAPKK